MLDPQHLIIAGAGAVELVERARPVEGDRDATFKSALSKSHAEPKGQPLVSKAQPDDDTPVDLTRPDACSKLIRRAHTAGTPWQPFAVDQHVAKAAEFAAGGGRIVRIFKEGGETRFVVEHA